MYHTINQYHPIGQGCFYTGQFFIEGARVFNFVYDCGTNSEHEYLLDAINSSPIKKRKSSKIDVCMISHFHHDHTSGIPHLLKGTRCDRLVIPYYNPIERLIIYLDSGVTDDDYRRMMEDPYTYFSGGNFDIGEIIVVGGGPQNQTVESRRPVAPAPDGDNFRSEELNFGKARDYYADDWQDEDLNLAFFEQINDYDPAGDFSKVSVKTIPYQMRTPLYKFIFYCRTMENGTDADARLRILELKKHINNYYSDQLKKSKLSEFKDLFNAIHIKEVARIYGGVFGGTNKLNGTSLAVYHQTTLSAEGYLAFQYLPTRFKPTVKKRQELGSMMTGDLDLESKEKLELFQEYYKHYLPEIGYFQAMHHGSDRNWPFGIPSSRLHTFPAYIVNHGAGRSHHPGKEVGKLLRRKCPLNVYLNNEFTPVTYGYAFSLRR